MSDHISSLRLSVQGPFQSQSASPGLDSLVQGDSVVFSSDIQAQLHIQ